MAQDPGDDRHESDSGSSASLDIHVAWNFTPLFEPATVFDDLSSSSMPRGAKARGTNHTVAVKIPKTNHSVAIASLPKQQVPFMNLPAEIRNLIYEYALVAPNQPVALHVPDSKSPDVEQRRLQVKANTGIATSTLRLNRQIYHESIGFLYRNDFEVRMEDIRRFAYLLGLIVPNSAAVLETMALYHPNSAARYTSNLQSVWRDRFSVSDNITKIIIAFDECDDSYLGDQGDMAGVRACYYLGMWIELKGLTHNNKLAALDNLFLRWDNIPAERKPEKHLDRFYKVLEQGFSSIRTSL